MTLSSVLSELRLRPEFARCVAEWREIPARPAQYADWPAGISSRLVGVLAQRGIQHPYTHQAAAIRVALGGENVVVVTPTASGKTLCYNAPALTALLADRTARALYLFPTKALAQDQLHELRGLISDLGVDLDARTYDGDTAAGERAGVRRKARVVISNPDMLHMGILPHHTRWAEFLGSLRYIVIDEIHAYRGVFGSHLANVIRRLKRVCGFYGSSPQFVLSSATVGNAPEFASRLIEEPVVEVSNSGAPAGAKEIIFYLPPLVNQELGIRRGAHLEARSLAREFLLGGVQSIVFARTRLTTEVILRYLQEDLARRGMDQGEVQGYRGGYLPTERRRIERGLREAEVRCVVATTALELGIDIGQLDACVMTGYPGTIASMWQQAGRAGRRNDVSAAILVASASPLDQYLIQHPDYFFGASPERVLVDPNNLVILANHMRCAAFELPFEVGEAYGDLSAEQTADVLTYLADAGELYRSGTSWHWMSESYPAQAVALRTADPDRFAIMDAAGGNRVIGELDRFAAPALIHEGAIYLHQGVSYQVDRLDWEGRRAYVQPAEVGFYTQANLSERVSVIDVLEEMPVTGGKRGRGEVLVTSAANSYRRLRYYTREILGYGEIALPEQEMHTTAYWFTLSREAPPASEARDRGPNWAVQRRQARERDGQLCQVCGAAERGREHDVHHIRPFREFDYAPGRNNNYLRANALDNLITLCHECHRKVSGDRVSRSALSNGLRGIAYALRHLAPLHLMCEPGNLGVFSDVRSELDQRPAVFVYDHVPAGVGFSEVLFDLHDELMAQVRETIAACPCAQGCPSCVGAAAAEGEGGKDAALDLLATLHAGAE